MKLPKHLAKLHREALALVRFGRTLTSDERSFVLEHYHEGAEHMNGLSGAFFTPPGLARDFAIEVPERHRILDLCAGIGALAYACEHKCDEIVCVERNQQYVDVGKVVVPAATWVCADVFDVEAYRHLGPFDVVIANPPFGNVPADGFSGLYSGSDFEYRVIELASRLAHYGVFIVPQMSAPFRYSGAQCFEWREEARAKKFRELTNIYMQPNCGIDTAQYRNAWKGVSPICEIVCCEFGTPKARGVENAPVAPSPLAREQLDLFGGDA